MKPGIHHNLPASAYHADPAEQPSLSCSVAQILLDTTPRRARFAHPRLSGRPAGAAPTREMDEGTALHTLVLGTGTEIVELPFPDLRSAAARTMRDDAHAADRVPILSARLAELRGIAAAVAENVLRNPEICDMLAPDASSEVTLIWQDSGAGGALCRARVDRMPADPHAPLYDLKFTSRLTPPGAWDRTVHDSGWDMRAAFYTRGVWELRGEAAPYVFVVCETTPPYDVIPLQCTPAFLGLGEQKAEAALELWTQCLASGEWPGYPPRIFHVSPPGWADAKWRDRQDLRMYAPRMVAAPERPSLLEWLESDPVNPMMSG